MSNNAWETTSPTSLHPLTHFLCHTIIRSLATYNDVADVVISNISTFHPLFHLLKK